MAAQLLAELGLADRVELRSTRSAIRRRARPGARRWSSISARREADLSEESRERLEKNPLRILDCKQHQDFPVVDSAPVIDDFLTARGGRHLRRGDGRARRGSASTGRATRGWSAASIITATPPSNMSPTELGAQAQVIGGGRYDGLIESLGGPPRPRSAGRPGSSGWRCCSTRPSRAASTPRSCRWARRPRSRRCASSPSFAPPASTCDMAFRGNLKKRMQKAGASGARYAIILGDDELARGEAAVKDLASGEQSERARSLGSPRALTPA